MFFNHGKFSNFKKLLKFFPGISPLLKLLGVDVALGEQASTV